MNAVTGRTGDLDKEWITCDNWASSPFRGHCYLSYFHVGSGEIRTTTTTDGGVTWSAPVASSPVPSQEYDFNGAQPLVLPTGTVVVVYTAFADPRFGARSEIQATRSTDGGASFSAPVRAAFLSTAEIPAMRTFALASAEVDAAGRMYVVWEGCPGGGTCSASRIVMIDLHRRRELDARAVGDCRRRRGRPLPPGDRGQPGNSRQTRARVPLHP